MSAPPRDWLDLKKIRSLVPFLFMIERTPVKDYVWRLAGTRACELWGMELTGKPVLTHGERFERETVARLLDGVIDAHQPFVLRFRLKSALDMSVAAESVGMPLRSRNGQMTYVFGVIMPFRTVSRPRHDHVTGFELSAARTIWTEPVPGAGNKPPAPSSSQAFQVINGGRSD
jgi:hypothetical protein